MTTSRLYTCDMPRTVQIHVRGEQAIKVTVDEVKEENIGRPPETSLVLYLDGNKIGQYRMADLAGWVFLDEPKR